MYAHPGTMAVNFRVISGNKAGREVFIAHSVNIALLTLNPSEALTRLGHLQSGKVFSFTAGLEPVLLHFLAVHKFPPWR